MSSDHCSGTPSPNTTMIYAKTDVVMLQEIVQPWLGGLEK